MKRGSKGFCLYYYEEEGDFCSAKNLDCDCGGQKDACNYPQYFNCSESELLRLKAEDRMERDIAWAEAYK